MFQTKSFVVLNGALPVLLSTVALIRVGAVTGGLRRTSTSISFVFETLSFKSRDTVGQNSQEQDRVPLRGSAGG